jgi:integrase
VKGTVNKRPTRGGRAKWEYCFDLGKDATGKRRRVTKSGFDTKREAEEAMAKALAEHRDQPAKKEEQPIPTFAEFFARWHHEVVMRMHGPKTYERSYEQAQYAIRLFGDKLLDELSPEQLTTDMNSLEDHGGKKTKRHPEGSPLSSTTVRHIEFVVQACLEQATNWDIIARNPMKRVKKHRRAKKTGDAPVADQHGLERFLKVVAGTSLYAPGMVDAATGMRRGELLALAWPDLDEEKSTLIVSKSLSETKKFGLHLKSTKSGKSRRFPIGPDVLDVLRDHRREQEEHRELYGPDYHSDLNLIFCRPDGYYYSPDKFGTRIKAALRKAGLGNLSLHSLRHSHASQLLSDGVPAAAVSERLGHANPGITHAIYEHAMPADNQAAALVWNNAMKDVIERSRKENFARKRRVTANDSEDSEKIRVIPIKSAS